MLVRVQTLIDAGLPMSALIVAHKTGVQFKVRTIRKWRMGSGPRRTYAWLVLLGWNEVLAAGPAAI
jgi:hypothetical protein